jgi:spermidine synthase
LDSTQPKRPPQTLPGVTLSEDDGVRYLHLDTPWIQGGMRIRAPQVVEIDYVQRMLAALLWLPPDGPADGAAVQLGLGAGALTRFTAQQLKMATTVVEINPQVIAANQRHFHLPREAEVVLGDAADWLAQAPERCVRLLFVDLYDHEAAAPVLDGAEFYAACHRVLEPGGAMAVNLFGRDASFGDSLGRIAAAFGPAHTWSLRPTRQGNSVVVATRGARLPARAELLARAALAEQRFGRLKLAARQWPRMIRPCPVGLTAAVAAEPLPLRGNHSGAPGCAS